MADHGISVREFEAIMREGMQEVCAVEGWDISKAHHRGYAFALWFAAIAAEAETFDTDPRDAMLYSRDLKADLIFEDTDARQVRICQCKWIGQRGRLEESDVNDFFNRHQHFADAAWVTEHGGVEAKRLLGDYAEKIADGWSANYQFVTNGTASDRIHDLVNRVNQEYSKRGVPVACELLDFSGLKTYYYTARTIELSIPEEVGIDLPTGRFFEKTEPRPTIVAVVKGNTLRNLYAQHKQSLYAWNIRGYLGNRGINSEISHTAAERPSDFFYFNNGVSAICTEYSLVENHLRARNLQIINGAQTVTSLFHEAARPEIEVLFRITAGESVKTEKGFNQEMIRYNNSQNQVKVSDFRSNDPVQLWLEQAFKDRKQRGGIPRIWYVRKRSVGRKGVPGSYNLSMELLGKLRYAFLYEPTRIHSAPKSLWLTKDAGGAYEFAFGVSGELQDQWSAEVMDEACIAVALYRRIDEDLATEKEPDLQYLKRLRFHAVALAGTFVRDRYGDDWQTLARSEPALDGMWTNFWRDAKGACINGFNTAEEQGVTLFAFVRSVERWEAMRRRFGQLVRR
jgi:hypothetical protein